MSTLIAIYDAAGCIARCDARCYSATDPHCDCICRGANHGKGYRAAALHTATAGKLIVEAYAKDNPHLNVTSYKTDGKRQNAKQRELFPP